MQRLKYVTKIFWTLCHWLPWVRHVAIKQDWPKWQKFGFDGSTSPQNIKGKLITWHRESMADQCLQEAKLTLTISALPHTPPDSMKIHNLLSKCYQWNTFHWRLSSSSPMESDLHSPLNYWIILVFTNLTSILRHAVTFHTPKYTCLIPLLLATHAPLAAKLLQRITLLLQCSPPTPSFLTTTSPLKVLKVKVKISNGLNAYASYYATISQHHIPHTLYFIHCFVFLWLGHWKP